MLRKSEHSEHNGRGIVASSFFSDGSQWSLAVLRGAGTMYDHLDPRLYYFVSDSERLQQVAIRLLPPIILKTLKKAEWQASDVDLVVPHQVSVKVVKKISRTVGIPFERCWLTIDRFGNTAAASMPMGLAEAEAAGRLHPGTRVLLVGGASGFSAAAMSLIW